MRIWIVFLMSMVPVLLWAQPDSLWSRTFGGPSNEFCYGMQQTADHGYILAGQALPEGSFYYKAWLVKTDADGIGEFSRFFGGSASDWADAVCQTADSGYVMAGTSWSYGPGDRSVGWIFKAAANGDSLWSRTWDGGAYETEFFSVKPTASGGLILAGRISFGTPGNSQACLVCTDATGNQLWSRTYGSLGNGYFKSVIQCSDGGFVACGTISTSAEASHGWALKTDVGGTQQWSQTYDPGTNDILNSIYQVSDGGFLAAGSAYVNGQRLWISRMSPNGDWWGLPGPWMPSPYSEGELTYIRELPDGTWMAAGTLCCNGNGSDFALLRTVYALDIRTYGGWGPEWCYAAAFTADGGYAMAGYTASLGAGGDDFFLLKTRSEFSAADDGRAVLPESIGLAAYPNPFNPTTMISFTLPRAGLVKLEIFDITGRLVRTMADQRFEAGEHALNFDGRELASGIYFARLNAGNAEKTVKLLLIR